LLRKRIELLKLEDQMNTTRVLDPAGVPAQHTKPKRLLIVLLTVIATGILAVLALLLKEWVATVRKVNQNYS
jgi:uncharacterized protein involved in exopolysaccharide biosynthesis